MHLSHDAMYHSLDASVSRFIILSMHLSLGVSVSRCIIPLIHQFLAVVDFIFHKVFSLFFPRSRNCPPSVEHCPPPHEGLSCLWRVLLCLFSWLCLRLATLLLLSQLNQKDFFLLLFQLAQQQNKRMFGQQKNAAEQYFKTNYEALLEPHNKLQKKTCLLVN